MDEDAHIVPSFSDLVRWLLICAVMLVVLPPLVVEGPKETLAVVEKPAVFEKENILRHDSIENMEEEHPARDRLLHSTADEMPGIEMPPSLSKIDSSSTNACLSSSRGRRGVHLFSPIIYQAAVQYEVDPALISAVIMAESGYNPRAVSKRGAKGLMQLMPTTAKALGVEDSFDPEHNVHAGVKYLRQLLEKFDGDVKLALAAYNAGSRKVKKYRGIPPFKATQYYVKKVFEYYECYKDQMMHTRERASVQPHDTYLLTFLKSKPN